MDWDYNPRTVVTWNGHSSVKFRLVYTGAGFELQRTENEDSDWIRVKKDNCFNLLACIVAGVDAPTIDAFIEEMD